MSEALALTVLAASLAAAVARPRWAPEWAVAAGGAVLLVAVGVLSFKGARSALSALGPTVGFLAALLVLADGCRRAGVFEALGAWMARGARGAPRRLLVLVFVVAALTTAVLSLDATIVLLTPIVFTTAARLPTNPRPHVYACSHLANTASLLLPVSNLTNLLAFRASGLSFTRFGALMMVPWLVALAIEWAVLSRSFAGELRGGSFAGELRGGSFAGEVRGGSFAGEVRGGSARSAQSATEVPVPTFALSVVALTLVGFGLSSLIGIEPVWIAAAGAAALVLAQRPAPTALVAAAEPTFLVFVLALGVVVAAAGEHGLSSLIDKLVPHGTGPLALLAVAFVSALVANIVNNLPATLMILPVAAASGQATVLAMLVGVNVGPNLTYVGSLATLLWRRIVHAHDHETDIGEFTRLGALTVPAVLLASTLTLWLALQVV